MNTVDIVNCAVSIYNNIKPIMVVTIRQLITRIHNLRIDSIDYIRQIIVNHNILSYFTKMDATEAEIISEFKIKIMNHIRGRFPRMVIGSSNPRIPFMVASCSHSCHSSGLKYTYDHRVASMEGCDVSIKYYEKNKNIAISLGLYRPLGRDDSPWWQDDIIVPINSHNFFEELDKKLDEKIEKYITEQRHLMDLLKKKLDKWELSIMKNRECNSKSDLGNVLETQKTNWF